MTRSQRSGNAPWIALGVLLTVLTMAFCSPAATAADLTASDVQRAIDGGVEFLRRQQLRNGSWGDYSAYTGGKTALCALAMLSCGVPKEDPQLALAIEYLRKIPPQYTYVVSLQTMVFCAADPERDKELIIRNVHWLERMQNQGPPRPGTWSYFEATRAYGDNSNTQFAILALNEASNAGFKVNPVVWEKAIKHWRQGQTANGGWRYYPVERLPETGSMTCAGLASMIILSDKINANNGVFRDNEFFCCQNLETNDNQRRIRAGLQWLASHFSVTRNPGDNRVLYYLYALERVGRMSGQRFIGSHDWYREGSDYLIRLKGARVNSGQTLEYWVGEDAEERDPIIATCYALLFLSKGRRAVLISKLEYGLTENWNVHHSDIKHLTAYVEQRWHKEMTWQNVDLNAATVDDLQLSPILYLGGVNSPVPTNEAQAKKLAQKLRDYLDRGGFIVAESVCSGAAFDSGFKRLIMLMFPGESDLLQPLPPEHPIWRAEVPIKPTQLRPIYGVSFGCRTSIVYLPSQTGVPSLSCLWEAAPALKNDPTILPENLEKIEGGLNLGLNIASYATNRELKTKDLVLASQNDSSNFEQTVRGRLYVANVRHPGGCQSAPRALQNLLNSAAKELGLRTGVEERKIALSDAKLYEFPILFMHGRTAFNLTDVERSKLKAYLDRGGVLFVNSICGSDAFTNSFRRQVELMYPDQKLKPIPGSDPVWTNQFGGFDLKQVEIRLKSSGAAADKTSVVKKPVQMEALTVNGRYAIFFSPIDLSCALEQYSSASCPGYSVQDAAKIGLNVILYAVEK